MDFLVSFLNKQEFRKEVIGTKIKYKRVREYTGIVMEVIPGGFKIGETINGPVQHRDIRWYQIIEFEPHINDLLTKEELLLIKNEFDRCERGILIHLEEINRYLGRI